MKDHLTICIQVHLRPPHLGHRRFQPAHGPLDAWGPRVHEKVQDSQGHAGEIRTGEIYTLKFISCFFVSHLPLRCHQSFFSVSKSNRASISSMKCFWLTWAQILITILCNPRPSYVSDGPPWLPVPSLSQLDPRLRGGTLQLPGNQEPQTRRRQNHQVSNMNLISTKK